jgi:nitrate reductase gamma subunit
MVLIGHTMLVADLTALWKNPAFENLWADPICVTIARVAGLVLLAAAFYLFTRRFSSQRVREISGFGDYMSIALILSVVISGDLMRFSPSFDRAAVCEFLSGLISFKVTAVPRDPFFLLHLLFAQVLVMYIPFSKFLHIPGVFYCKAALYRS